MEGARSLMEAVVVAPLALALVAACDRRPAVKGVLTSFPISNLTSFDVQTQKPVTSKPRSPNPPLSPALLAARDRRPGREGGSAPYVIYYTTFCTGVF